jgi:predicted DNA-binding transcriptional regulator AlpA
MPDLADYPQTLTTSQVAEVTGISRRRIVAMMLRGDFPRPVDSGNGYNWHRWSRKAVERWLKTSS